MKIPTFASSLLLAGTILSSSAINAQQLEITVTNLTQGIYYTPLLISAHNAEMSLYQLGQSASAELQAMAEGGDISGLSAMLSNANADTIENPAMGLLAPAASTTTMLTTTDGNNLLSLVAMILPTNDGFVGLNSWKIPSDAGSYSFTLNAYDAGTEVNNELINGGGAPGVLGIPAAPAGDGGTGGTGVTNNETNTMVHVHRGSLGDDDLAAGKSDLSNTVHRWLNPVARVTVKVM
jgi:spondin N